MKDKSIIRQRAIQRRKALSDSARDELSLAIANRLLRLDIWQGTHYHLFLTITEKGEIDTHSIMDILHGRDKTIVLSRANFSDSSLSHFILNESTRLSVSKYGIPEPQEGEQVSPTLMDVVFVPLLAYDRKGTRLGYGKGFYDRFLAQCPDHCLKIGLSFFEPETELIPCEDWDLALDMVVTPDAVHRF